MFGKGCKRAKASLSLPLPFTLPLFVFASTTFWSRLIKPPKVRLWPFQDLPCSRHLP